MKKNYYYYVIVLMMCLLQVLDASASRVFNGDYKGAFLDRVAFPIGGMGAGMFCIEGSGAISHLSVRNHPDLFNEPCMFAALHIDGMKNGTKVLEGQSPTWKRFGLPWSSLGLGGTSWGLPRFKENSFEARFPFATIKLKDDDMPVEVTLKAWSPFIPTDQDNSGMPIGAIEYTFHNTSANKVTGVFSYNSRNFMKDGNQGVAAVKQMKKGFVLSQTGEGKTLFNQGDFAIFTDAENASTNYCWFRGGWFDPLTVCWNQLESGTIVQNNTVPSDAPGASLYVPLQLKPNETKTIKVFMAWYVPHTNMRLGADAKVDRDFPTAWNKNDSTNIPQYYTPWYASRFKNIGEVTNYWKNNYDDLEAKTNKFTDAFYASTLPPEVLEAVSANLCILKSPTILRQFDGRFWAWEGSADNNGSCEGSCTHVWNYAQSLSHLFPAMERTLRETEFLVSQDKRGHQTFRSGLPIRPIIHDFHAASDGQLGGVMKVYRDWRIYGDSAWLRKLYPAVKQSLDYCIATWDPRGVGALEEPHHNTYDIEFWGPDGMCTSFYTGALHAFVLMGKFLNEDVSSYENLLAKSKTYMESKLYNGDYFIQDIRWKDLKASDPTKAQSFNSTYSSEAIKIMEKEGPKYQYGTGCLSDGILGSWMSLVCGMNEVIDSSKVKKHLVSVYEYNLKKDLREHSNPQRPTFAMGNEGGLLLCTWPKGGKLQLPFVYSDEVWTGIEYQVASHLMFEGEVEKGLDIVRTCRKRYDGKIRNPFNEYECGSWYARAMASYGLIEGLTGVRFDAVDGTLYINSRIGNNFVSFLSTNTGFGNVGLKSGVPFVVIKYGTLNIKRCVVSGKEIALAK